jgi:hypothetical protein
VLGARQIHQADAAHPLLVASQSNHDWFTYVCRVSWIVFCNAEVTNERKIMQALTDLTPYSCKIDRLSAESSRFLALDLEARLLLTLQESTRLTQRPSLR